MADQGEANNKQKKQYLTDHQLKELIRKEEEAKKHWSLKWEFIDREYEQNVYRKEAEKLGVIGEFLEKRNKKVAPQEIWKIEKSPPPPISSSRFIGWRSKPDYTLELAGPMYVSPKVGLEKESYNTFFLG